MKNADELNQHLLHVWHGMGKNIPDTSIDEWRGHLQACVQASDGNF